MYSANYKVLICCTCHFQNSCLFLFWLLLFACLFSVLISTLTQGSGVGYLFRLTCLVVLWGGSNTENKYHWRVWVWCVGWSACSVWATLGLPPLTVCVFSQSTLLRLQVALQGNYLKQALGCVHFPGLSCSGSGSWVLHKGADSVGPAFCALPRSEHLRQPGAWRVHTSQVWCVLPPPPSQLLGFLVVKQEHHLRCALSPLGS